MPTFFQQNEKILTIIERLWDLEKNHKIIDILELHLGVLGESNNSSI